MSRLSHEYPDQPEMWLAPEPKPVSEVLREIMHEQAELRGGGPLCEFCQTRPSTHTLVITSGSDLGGIPVECCDGCDDMEPSQLPIELSDR